MAKSLSPVLKSAFGSSPERFSVYLAGALLIFAMVLGGASRQNELRLAVIILSAIPLLVLAGDSVLGSRQRTLVSSWALAVLLGLLLVPLIQILPLPPAIWTNLPGRDEQVLALDIAGMVPGWGTLSTTPDKTWRSFLALIPPVAMFIGVLACTPDQRLTLVKLFLALAGACVVLGVAQLASGGRAFYPWHWTQAGSFTGFLANRNHLATLCLMAIPFLGILAARSRRGNRPQADLWMWLSVSGIALAVIAIGVGRSRAGITLVFPVVIATLLAFWLGSGRGRPRLPMLGLMAGAAAGFGALVIFALGPIVERFDVVEVREGRFENWPIVLEAAENYLPLGSGVGSFDRVYRSMEPLDQLDSTYFNQAHNDYLESWLEAGWPAAILLCAFLFWFAKRSWSAWRAGASTTRDLQRASSLAISAVLLHSFVDYPLRTETIAVAFALCCALLEFDAQSPDCMGHRPNGQLAG